MRTRPPDLDDQLDRLERISPAFLAKPIHFLRAPGLRWLRMTAGILLIVGSFFWFLPILGLEMFPIGLMLIAIDVPFLRGPVARMIAWGERVAIGLIALWEVVGARVRGSGSSGRGRSPPAAPPRGAGPGRTVPSRANLPGSNGTARR
jgi:hypothetical protein